MKPEEIQDAMARYAMELACPAYAYPPPSQPAPTRTCLEGRLAALEDELLRHDSVTLALEQWCRAAGLASSDRVTAQIVSAADADPSAERRGLLRIGPLEPVRHRRVRLMFGGHVLSEAENWYVPGRLTGAMRRQLDRTSIPFGCVVRALRFRRLRLAVERLWDPSSTSCTMAHPAAQAPPFVLRHRALLLRMDGLPFSEVVETYTRDALLIDCPA